MGSDASNRSLASIGRVAEREPVCMERLPRERNRAQRPLPDDVPTFADQRVPAQPRLGADLIALAGSEPNLDERRAGELLEDAILADRFLAAWIARACLFLDERTRVPHQDESRQVPAGGLGWPYTIAQYTRSGSRRLNCSLSCRCVRGSLANTTRPDVSRSIRCTTKGRRLARAQVIPDLFVDRRRRAAPLERHREQAGRLVQHQHCLVFVDDLHVGVGVDGRRAPFRAAGPVHPHADDIAAGETSGGEGWRPLRRH